MTKKVADVMTQEVTTLFEENNLEQVLAILGPYRFRHLPVVDGKKVVGIISQRDLLQVVGERGRSSSADHARTARALEETFVRDIMNSNVLTVSKDASLAEAAHRMVEGHVGALPVVNEDGELQGIVTSSDLLRSLSHML